MQENEEKSSQAALDKPDIFPGFARIWACATLVHQLSFTFWAESWPGWVLVITAIAVLFQPRCLYRFSWMVGASVVNLVNKMPFVPNHILFEGMLHFIMILVLAELIFRSKGGNFLKDGIQDGWKLRFLVGIIVLKAAYHLVPGIPKNYILGSISTALLLLSVGLNLFGKKPVNRGGPFISTYAPVLRIAIVMMYFWAAIQKMNFDYLNPDISCASKLHVEIAHYFGELVPTKEWALHGAIWGSLFFELAIPIFLMIPKTRIAGVLCAVWFHLWLSMHHAAGIFSFSSLILAVLYLFLPVGIWKELKSQFDAQLKKIGRGDRSRGDKITVIFVTLFFFAILFTQITMYLTTARSYQVFDTANRIGYIGFATWGLWLGVNYVIAALKSRGREGQFPNQPVKTIAWVGLFLVLMNGASPWLGGKTQTAFSMYSNLRSEGKGNHCFLKRMDVLPYQKNLVKVIESEPNILDPSTRPTGIANFANIGHKVLPYFSLRRLVSTTDGDLSITYEQGGEIKKLVRAGDSVTGDEGLLKPIPLLQRKFLWFRRLDKFEGPMPCTH